MSEHEHEHTHDATQTHLHGTVPHAHPHRDHDHEHTEQAHEPARPDVAHLPPHVLEDGLEHVDEESG